MPIFLERLFILLLLFTVLSTHGQEPIHPKDTLQQASPASYLDTDKFLIIKEKIIIQTNLTKTPQTNNFSTVLLQIESDYNSDWTFLLDWSQPRKELSLFLIHDEFTRKFVVPTDSNFLKSPVRLQIHMDVRLDTCNIEVDGHTFHLNSLGLSPQRGYKFLLFPILQKQPSIYQPLVIKDTVVYTSNLQQSTTNLWAWFIAIIIIDILIFIWYQVRKKRRKARITAVPPPSDEIVLYQDESLIDISLPTQSAIYIFGQFTVWDRDGNDISRNFSPLLRELLLLIIVHTSDGGISSEQIKELLWSDKTNASARNNRAVSLAKLRSLLQSVGELSIDNDSGKWTLSTEDIFIDYTKYKELSAQNLQKADILTLISLISKGNILPNNEYKWLDSVRSDVSGSAIQTLMKYADLIQIEKEPRLTLKIAEFISKFDDLNEKALYLKCKAYSVLGQHSAAKNTYEKFVEEYEKAYGEAFRLPFSKLIELPDFHQPS